MFLTLNLIASNPDVAYIQGKLAAVSMEQWQNCVKENNILRFKNAQGKTTELPFTEFPQEFQSRLLQCLALKNLSKTATTPPPSMSTGEQKRPFTVMDTRASSAISHRSFTPPPEMSHQQPASVRSLTPTSYEGPDIPEEKVKEIEAKYLNAYREQKYDLKGHVHADGTFKYESTRTKAVIICRIVRFSSIFQSILNPLLEARIAERSQRTSRRPSPVPSVMSGLGNAVEQSDIGSVVPDECWEINSTGSARSFRSTTSSTLAPDERAAVEELRAKKAAKQEMAKLESARKSAQDQADRLEDMRKAIKLENDKLDVTTSYNKLVAAIEELFTEHKRSADQSVKNSFETIERKILTLKQTTATLCELIRTEETQRAMIPLTESVEAAHYNIAHSAMLATVKALWDARLLQEQTTMLQAEFVQRNAITAEASQLLALFANYSLLLKSWSSDLSTHVETLGAEYTSAESAAQALLEQKKHEWNLARKQLDDTQDEARALLLNQEAQQFSSFLRYLSYLQDTELAFNTHLKSVETGYSALEDAGQKTLAGIEKGSSNRALIDSQADKFLELFGQYFGAMTALEAEFQSHLENLGRDYISIEDASKKDLETKIVAWRLARLGLGAQEESTRAILINNQDAEWATLMHAVLKNVEKSQQRAVERMILPEILANQTHIGLDFLRDLENEHRSLLISNASHMFAELSKALDRGIDLYTPHTEKLATFEMWHRMYIMSLEALCEDTMMCGIKALNTLALAAGAKPNATASKKVLQSRSANTSHVGGKGSSSQPGSRAISPTAAAVKPKKNSEGSGCSVM